MNKHKTQHHRTSQKTSASVKTYTNQVGMLLGEQLQELQSASLKHSKFLDLLKDNKKKQLSRVAKIAQQNNLSPSQLPADTQFTLTLGGRLAINTSTGPIENAGIALHRHFNIPYIPGSALKGIARHQAWIEWKKADDKDKKGIDAQAVRIFGSSLDENSRQKIHKTDDNQKGCISFMPAYPVDNNWCLAVDILNSHGGNDYTNPVPCFFLTVEKGTRFTFSLYKLARANDDDMEQAKIWLKKGLCSQGAGAKTITGYGWFIDEDAKENKGITVRLDTPGFLGSAHQYGDDAQNDTQLRPSSLRGMLRWWWRALNRDFFEEALLKKMEDFLWGSTAKSGVIQLRIELRAENSESELFKFKDGYKVDRNFASNHSINPDNSGLHYLAYGMDEKNKREIKQRYFCPHGGKWTVVFSLRNNLKEYKEKIDGKEIAFSDEDIRNQAHAALSLLCRYGGIGSRSRKGFGSLSWKNAWTLEKCQDMAGQIVKKLGKIAPASPVEYGMKSAIYKEISIHYSDPWTILDRIGLTYKAVASSYKHKPEKKVLGLPRQIHGPREHPIGRQHPNTHQKPQHLKPLLPAAQNGKKTRFASPLWIHLEKTEKGMIIRLTAFPTNQIGSIKDSKEILQEIMSKIKEDLNKEQWNKMPKTSQGIHRKKNVPLQNSLNGWNSGDTIDVRLIEEKTKKDRWKAKIIGTEYIGSFMNPDKLPGDLKVGDELNVKLHSANAKNLSFKYIEKENT